MTANGVFQLVSYVVVLLALAKPLGAYMARVYEGRRRALDRVLGWLERLIYRAGGVWPNAEMGWKSYALAMLWFNRWLHAAIGTERLLWLAVSVFVLAWIAQFIGHKIEGKKPSFFTDVVYLLIGPAWILGKVFRNLGWRY